MNKGTTAQCMAQATDAATPKASQLIRKFIRRANLQKCNDVANNILN